MEPLGFSSPRQVLPGHGTLEFDPRPGAVVGEVSHSAEHTQTGGTDLG